jgi:hypothetical protein
MFLIIKAASEIFASGPGGKKRNRLMAVYLSTCKCESSVSSLP